MHKSSTWRELEAVNRVLHSLESSLEGHNVKWHTDNKNVAQIILVGSKRSELQDKALEIHSTCETSDVKIQPIWIPRERNKTADSLSRTQDSDDWKIDKLVFNSLDIEWGPHSYDRFASDYNRQCEKFNSRRWCPGTSGIDAFKQLWNRDCNWWVPPPSLIGKTIDKIESERSSGTLVIPLWRSAPFWPKVHGYACFKAFVKNFRQFHAEVVKRGRGQNGYFR